jgi:hypothetical protein
VLKKQEVYINLKGSADSIFLVGVGKSQIASANPAAIIRRRATSANPSGYLLARDRRPPAPGDDVLPVVLHRIYP